MPDVTEQLRRYAESLAEATEPVAVDRLPTARRRSLGLPMAVAALALVAVLVAVVVWSTSDGPSRITTVDDGPPPSPESPDDGEPSPGVAENAVPDADDVTPTDPALRLRPGGPYEHGQTVTLSWPEGHIGDTANERPRLCMIIADDPDTTFETCDPLQNPSLTGTATDADVVLTQRVFTPTGYRDCTEATVTCRLLHRRTDGTYGATEALVFDSDSPPPTASVTIAETSDPTTFVIEPDGLTPHPSWIQLREADPSRVEEYPAFFVQLCAFGSTEPEVAPFGTYLWLQFDRFFVNCDSKVSTIQIDPDDANAALPVSVPGRIHGYGGWSDCRVHNCFLQIRRSTVVSVDDEALVGGDQGVVADLVPFAPSTALPTLPSIEILDAGPHVAGQTIAVEVRDLPEGVTTNIGVCRVAEPFQCGYPADAFDLTDGTYELTLPESVAFCAPRTCYLELDAKGEGLPPLATAPLDTTG